jgi:hypothetical protein
MGASASSPGLRLDARRALCVGVNGVRNGAPLGGVPLRDAEDVAATLRRAGWTATVVLDPNVAELRAALDAFAASLSPDGASLFYFAGHAARDADGVNTLLPVEGTLPCLCAATAFEGFHSRTRTHARVAYTTHADALAATRLPVPTRQACPTTARCAPRAWRLTRCLRAWSPRAGC